MQNQSVVCTLFEGHYHYGVAALVNSLYEHGFRGNVYAGYRGELPFWANFPVSDVSIGWKGSKSFDVADGLRLHFLPVETTYHFTNYKPDFMLSLCYNIEIKAKQIIYFDPDIVVTAQWIYYKKWLECGVAVCEDVNSPLAEFHPRRVAWREYFFPKDIKLKFHSSIYVNGGFVATENVNFLLLWKRIQEAMAEQIGGLDRSSLTGTPLAEKNKSPFEPFSKTDQDALNAAIEAWDGKISFIGKEGMSFKHGSNFMMHALGQPKPWHRNPIQQAFFGIPPRRVDKYYWKFSTGIIRSQSTGIIRMTKLAITFAAFMGRFYSKREL